MSEIEGQIREQELDAEHQARRRLALAQIRQYPDPALRMAARPVETFDDELRHLVERMRLLMVDASGVGLAATQLGILQRLFVFDTGEDEAEIAALVNPVITDRMAMKDFSKGMARLKTGEASKILLYPNGVK